MNQPSLFDSLQEPPKPRAVNTHRIRVYLNWVLRTMRTAVVMPWHATELASQEVNFPIYARLLPTEEAEPMIAEFQIQLARIKTLP
jgi:hypothetical protein